MPTIVVLPTYNEADNIVRMLSLITGSETAPDVLVVDDSSPDGTGKLVSAYAACLPEGRVRLLTRRTKDGLGAAYREGIDRAIALGYDTIVQMDADGSHPVSALGAMQAKIAEGYDLVIGSRYVPGGGLSADWPVHRRLLSKGGNLYARSVLGLPIKDLTGGYKMWRATTLAAVDFADANAAGNCFIIQTTVAAVAAGARVAEVPIIFAERELGTSKMSGQVVAEAMLGVLKLRPLAAAPRSAGGGRLGAVSGRPAAGVPSAAKVTAA